MWHIEAAPTSGDSTSIERIVPDGCAEIIVHRGDPYRHLETEDATSSSLQPRTILAGILSRRLLLAPTGRVDAIGVRLRPHALARLGVPAASVVDRAIDLEAVFGPSARRFADDLCHAIDWSTRMDAVRRFFSGILREVRAPSRVAHAASWMSSRNGVLSVDSVAAAVGVGARQLEREFRRDSGVGPKTFARILRFRSVIDHLRSSPTASLARAARAFGYCDQAHLARDFVNFTGTSATNYLQESGQLDSCYASPEELRDSPS